MRKQITVDDKLNELVVRLASITDVSESCVYSYGIYRISQALNTCEDELFESLYDFAESYYKIQHKQGGKRNEKTQISTPKSS